jgi:hypothetical protein
MSAIIGRLGRTVGRSSAGTASRVGRKANSSESSTACKQRRAKALARAPCFGVQSLVESEDSERICGSTNMIGWWCNGHKSRLHEVEKKKIPKLYCNTLDLRF